MVNMASPGKRMLSPLTWDGSAATKNNEKHFGFKSPKLLNVLKDIEKLSVMQANVHDSQSNLSITSIS